MKCSVCGEEKIRGTTTIGKVVKPFWMCGTLQADHDEMLAMMEIEDDEIDWEDEEEMTWDDV